MNHLFLLKLIAEMLDSDKPTPEKVACARKILQQMIQEYDKPKIIEYQLNPDLDPEALNAKNDLIG